MGEKGRERNNARNMMQIYGREMNNAKKMKSKYIEGKKKMNYSKKKDDINIPYFISYGQQRGKR